jgi:uroporphyrinogen decarboxylase
MKTFANGDKLSSKERVLRTFRYGKADRVPVNYFANPGIDGKLKEYFGLKPDDGEGLKRALGVDFRGVGPVYTGPKLHQDIPERNVQVDNWGIHRTWVEHGTGGYWDFCDFPLEKATEEEIAAWPMPNPDHFDYSKIKEACLQYREYAINAGGAGTGDIINMNGMLRGVEQTLVDLLTDDPAGMLLARRRVDIQFEMISRSLEAADGGIDFLWLGEDLGSQNSPLISLELFRKQIRPLHQRFVDLAKNFNIPVMIHSCGSSSWAYEDFIEMGISVVDTLQPEAKNMSPEYLRKTFGNRLAYHGCISTGGPVAFGTPDDTVKYCQKTLDIMMPGGGYCFAPTHSLQDNSPLGNVLAMYETAHKCGKY